MDQEQMVCGGWSETKDATEETQEICDKVRRIIEEKTNTKYEFYRVVKYREQIVAGRKFHCKVYVGGENFIHVTVFQPLRGEPLLLSTQVDQKEDSAL